MWKLVFLIGLVPYIFCNPSLRFGSTDHLFKEEKPSGEDFVTVSVVFDDKSKSLQVKNGIVTPYVAQAFFKNTMNSTGWSLLKIYTNGQYDDNLQAQAAGMVEGFVTADHISMHYQNTLAGYCDNDKEFCDKLKKFLADMFEWINSQIKANPLDTYWHQVSLVVDQLAALPKGYSLSKMKPSLVNEDFLLMNSFGDLEDLEQALGKKTLSKVKGSGSCSALVKLFEFNQDLAISQVTWNDFNSMLRIFKYYNLSFHMNSHKESPLIKGQIQSFSSYPSLIYSGDDFYILSSGLISQETTIGNSNAKLWKYVTSSTILEWIRAIVANRLAKDGNTWCSIFERHNSGTYNNQWMILDYNKFTRGKPLQPDTLWILEQLPGIVHMADMSVHLEEHGYWASYNVPYFPYIYNMSGAIDDKEKYGSWFDYYETPRAQIFKRDQNKVTDMQSLVKLMRYNDFQHDPLAKCNCTPPYSGENAISARSDLNPANGTYPIPSLGHRRHGGTDCKATNFEMARKFSQFVVAGPTYDQQQPFQWSKTEWKKPVGHPDVFKFTTKLLDWNLEHWLDWNLEQWPMPPEM